MHAGETGIPACSFCNLLICNCFSYASWIFNRHKPVFWFLLYDTIHACYYLFVIRSYYLFRIPATTYRELVVLPVVSFLHVVI